MAEVVSVWVLVLRVVSALVQEFPYSTAAMVSERVESTQGAVLEASPQYNTEATELAPAEPVLESVQVPALPCSRAEAESA
jgi:hypothetical protein